MKIRTTVRYHYTAAGMGIVKSHIYIHTHSRAQKDRKRITSIGEDMEKLEPLYIIGGNAKCCSHFGKH